MRSFDVFETALVRRVGTPDSVFLLLGANPKVSRITGLSEHRFAELRRWCEHEARFGHPSREIPLEEIYRKLARDLALPQSCVTTLTDAELEYEAVLLTPNPLIRRLVTEARRSNGRVIWLSDTYVPASWLTAQLVRHGLLEPGDLVYVSNEHRASKTYGDLYELVAKEVGVEPKALKHTGNDEWADIAQARAAGWRVRPARQANPNRYESALEACAAPSAGLSSLLAGASITTRLKREAAAADPALWNVAASIGGPALGSFALWLLLRAVELGLERIYFVARDGELLLRIARALRPCIPDAMGLELRYLYGSRQAWHLPSADLEPHRIAEWLGAGASQASPRELLARLRMEPRDIADLLIVDDPDVLLGEGAARFVEELLGNPTFRARVHKAAKASRAVLLGYLRQEGLLDEKPYACVELGWHGRAARSLHLVMDSAGHRGAVRHQFFSLHRAADQSDEAPPNAEAFLRDLRDGGDDVSWAHQYLLEAFCAGLEGRTITVEARDDGYEPVLERARNEPAISWGLPEFYEGVECFARELASGIRAAPGVATKANVLTLRPAIDVILETLWREPSNAEAAAVGSYPLRASILDSGLQTLARPFSWKDVVVALNPLQAFERPEWHAGSIALSTPALRRMQRVRSQMRSVLGKTRAY